MGKAKNNPRGITVEINNYLKLISNSQKRRNDTELNSYTYIYNFLIYFNR